MINVLLFPGEGLNRMRLYGEVVLMAGLRYKGLDGVVATGLSCVTRMLAFFCYIE